MALAAGGLALDGPRGRARAGASTGGAQTARKGLIRPRRSPWVTRLEGDLLQCTLCPKDCRLAPGQRGLCRVRENRQGELVSLVHGTPVILQMDPIERKPFFHVRPGSQSLSVSTAGCNFDCKFCEVWDTVLVAPEDIHAYDVPVGDVVRHAREAGAASIAYTFGEPVVFFEYMLDIAHETRQAGLLNLLHSNGYIRSAPLEALMPVLDGANIDLKGFSEAFYREVCAGELQPVLDTLERLHAAGVHLEITTLLIPTLNDDLSMIKRMCGWIREHLGAETPLHLSRFYPLYKLADLPPTPVSSLERARDTALAAGLNYVYLAKVPGHAAETTRCAGCGQVVIERLGFVVDAVALEQDRCGHCGRRLPGVWEG